MPTNSYGDILMYLMTILGKEKLYSSIENAHKEGARFIKKYLINNYSRHNGTNVIIQDAYNQERYSDVVVIWNDMIDRDDYYHGNPFHKVVVQWMEIDKSFY